MSLNIAYNYSYDALNRLTGVSYLRDSTTGWVSKTWFGESGYGYDQNGNITGLNRNSYNGTVALDESTQKAYEYVLKNYAKGGRVVIYGYSFGGVLAAYLQERLRENNIEVNFLVTVDAAAGPQTDQVSRVVSNSKENLNIFQTSPSPVRSHGAENKRPDGSTNGITNRIKVKYVDENGKTTKMKHSVMGEKTATEVINEVLQRLKAKK